MTQLSFCVELIHHAATIDASRERHGAIPMALTLLTRRVSEGFLRENR